MASMPVLDSAAIINALSSSVAEQCFTTSGVLEEVKDARSRIVVEAALEQEKLVVTEPSAEFLHRVRTVARNTGDLTKLSDTDLSVLALAWEKQQTLLTDDYAMQNVAQTLHVKVQPVLFEGIKEQRSYVKRCPACKRSYAADAATCEDCGTALKRQKK